LIKLYDIRVVTETRWYYATVTLLTVYEGLLVVHKPVIRPTEYPSVEKATRLYGFPESCGYQFLPDTGYGVGTLDSSLYDQIIR
jgi:hypothetical protein